MRGGMRAATAMVGVAAVCAFAGCGGDDAPAGCHARLLHGVIPPWARAGFTAAEPRMPHVVGRAGEIAALVFGDPLTSPPRRTRNNKILWVARSPLRAPSDLRISAQRYAAGDPVGARVTRVVAGGPGPSIVDLPAPGCWHLELHWGRHADAVDLRYARGS